METQFGILGPLAAGSGETSLPGRNLRIVLAALLCQANRVVSDEALIEAIWETAPPRSAAKNLQVYVYHLRKLIGGDLIARHPHGYRLTVEGDQLDALLFERLTREGEGAVAAGDIARGRELLVRGLGLWRGPVLADLSTSGAFRETVARLEELRLAALEFRVDADLALGEHHAVARELAGLLAANPMRERMRSQLMTALYRSGRQADALNLFQEGRQLLVDELGVEPGEVLHDAYVAILRGIDPVTASRRQEPPPPAQVKAETAAPPMQLRLLPREIPDFTGRADDLAALSALAVEAASAGMVVITAIAGLGGVGKTALAVKWARSVLDDFPDGQLYLDLRGYHPLTPMHPAEALGHLLRTLGVPGDQIPQSVDAAAALYRSMLAGKRVLVLLDNVNTADQVRPLLPGTADCLVLVTSRDQLTGLIARDGARRITLGMLSEADAIKLFGKILGRERVNREPAAARHLAAICGHLPLALRIAAATLAERTHVGIAEYCREIEAGDRIAALGIADDPQTSVRAVFDHSYRALPGAEARLFRLLGLVPGPDATADAAAALTGGTTVEAASILARLVSAGLVTEHAPGRFQMHDLMREYALERTRSDETDRGERSLRRLLDWYLGCCEAATDLLYPMMLTLPPTGSPAAFASAADASRWMGAETANLIAAVEAAADSVKPAISWHLAAGLRGYLWKQRLPGEMLQVLRQGLRASTAAGDLRGQAVMHLGISSAHTIAQRTDEAAEPGRRAYELAAAAGWAEGQISSLNNLATIAIMGVGRTEEAITYLDAALAVDEEIAMGTTTPQRLAQAHILRGNLPAATDVLTRSVAHHRATGKGVILTDLQLLSEVLMLRGRVDEALPLIEDVMTSAEALGVASDIAWVKQTRAMIFMALGNHERAAADLAESGPVLEEKKNVLALARHLHLQAEADLRAGDLDSAAMRIERGLAMIDAHRHDHLAAETLTVAAQVRLRHGDPATATAHAQAAADIAERCGYRLLLGLALTVIVEISIAAGTPDRAGHLLRQALPLVREADHHDGIARAEALAASLGIVAGGAADDEGCGHALIHEVGDEALAHVGQVVAVVHPDAGVVGDERDHIGLAVVHGQRVDPPR